METDITSLTSFQNPLDRADFTPMNSAAFQACLEDRPPWISKTNDKEIIEKYDNEPSYAMEETVATFPPERRPLSDARCALPASIQDEIHLNNQLKNQWQGTRNPALKAEVSRLRSSVNFRLNEWTNEHWSDMLESLNSEDQSLWKMKKRVIQFQVFYFVASAGRSSPP